MVMGCSEFAMVAGGCKAREGGALSRPARGKTEDSESHLDVQSTVQVPVCSGEWSKSRRSITEWKAHLEGMMPTLMWPSCFSPLTSPQVH